MTLIIATVKSKRRRQPDKSHAAASPPAGRPTPLFCSTQPAPPPASWDLLIAAALTIGTFLLYVPTLKFGFLALDDPFYVTNRPIVQEGLTFEGLRWAFTTPAFANWLPVTWLSHMLDCELYGLNAAGHHATNALLHAANAALLYVVMSRATGARARSLTVAALFAAHPLRVESVAWIAERKDVLCGTFFLLTLLGYIAYARRPRPSAYVIVLVAFAMGLMAKTMIVTMPFLLLLLDVWPLRRMFVGRSSAPDVDSAAPDAPALPRRDVESLLLEKLPLLALAAVAAWWTVTYQREGAALEGGAHLTLAQRAANAVVSVARYLGKTVWPMDLSVLYPHPGDWPAWQIAASAALVATITVAVLIAARLGRTYFAVGWFWFLGMLVPVSGIVMQAGDQAMADRYTYLPGIGLLGAVVWGVADAARSHVFVRRALWPVAVAIVMALSVVTLLQQRYWRDTEELATRAVAVDDDNWAAHMLLANERLAERNAAGFFEHTLAAGRGLRRMGRISEAIETAQLLARAYPMHPGPRLELGLSLIDAERAAESERAFTEARRLAPDDPAVTAACGRALLDLGRRDDAIQLLRLARMNGHADAALIEQIDQALRRAGAAP